MNKIKGRKTKRGMGILLAMAVAFQMLPFGGMTVSARGGYQIYIQVPESWTNMKCYAYVEETDADGEKTVIKNAGWPGEDMTDHGGGYWSYTIPERVAGPQTQIMFYSSDVNRYPEDMQPGLICDSEGIWQFTCDGGDGCTWEKHSEENHLYKDGTCIVCTSCAVAEVVKDGVTTTVLSLDDVFKANNDRAEVKLLADVDLGDDTLDVASLFCTLDLNGHTISSSGTCMRVRRGPITVTGTGSIKSTGGMAMSVEGGTASLAGGCILTTESSEYAALSVTSGGSLYVRSDDVVISGEGIGVDLANGQDGNAFAHFTGGTYSGITPIRINADNVTSLGYLLGDSIGNEGAVKYAFYDGDKPIPGVFETRALPEGINSVTVKVCGHEEIRKMHGTEGYVHDCTACGRTEKGSYRYESVDADTHKAVCPKCGYSVAGQHTYARGWCSTKEEDGITYIYRQCDKCHQSGERIGSVTFPEREISVCQGETAVLTVSSTIPDAVYEWHIGDMGDGTPVEGAVYTLPDDLDIGTYELLCEVKWESSGTSRWILINVLGLITDEAVTLSSESAVYNGSDQKPSVTVMKGETELAEGTDYEISYLRNGTETDDFANAGTITVVVAGKGSYTGTVEKTFTVAPAVPVIAWENTAQELIYTGQPATVTTPAVTLVNGESFSGTVNYSYAEEGSDRYVSGLPTDAGTYTVKADLAKQGNYAAADSRNTLVLTINKAVPYIAALPTAGAITSGDTLYESVLLGGTAQYGDGIGNAGSTEEVAGTFAWKDPSEKPAVSDSGRTEYTVVFTPSDTADYETVECRVMLTVQDADRLPDAGMPSIKEDVGEENVSSGTPAAEMKTDAGGSGSAGASVQSPQTGDRERLWRNIIACTLAVTGMGMIAAAGRKKEREGNILT